MASFFLSIRVLAVSISAIFFIIWATHFSHSMVRSLSGEAEDMRKELKKGIDAPLSKGQFPEVIQFPSGGGFYKARVKYTLNLDAQKKMSRLLERWKPDYAAFVAMDAETGKILSLVSYARYRKDLGNLALRASFPAASIFKIITATAAIDQGRVKPDTVFSFNGANHTLYRRNVTSTHQNRWTRYMPLRKAFAQSVNTVFGKLGIFHLDEELLKKYAGRFLFNRKIPSDIPIKKGFFYIEPDNTFNLAEVACGYNREVLISPLQGALMAAAVVNDGVIMAPYVVESLLRWDGTVARETDGEPVYLAEPFPASVTMSQSTAFDMRLLMSETIKRGTARTAFAGVFRRRNFEAYEIGGKTGSLKGRSPEGNNDWFVGYALSETKRVAVAALTVNVDKWRIRSTTIARKFFEHYFRKKRNKAE